MGIYRHQFMYNQKVIVFDFFLQFIVPPTSHAFKSGWGSGGQKIHFASSRFYLVLISCLAVALTPNPPHHILSIPVWCGTQISTSKISWMIFVIYSRTNVSQFCFVICFNVLMQHDKTSLRNFDWLIWHKLQRAYVIMNCPSCVIVVVVVNENFLGDIT